MKASRVFLSWSGEPCRSVAEGLHVMLGGLDVGLQPWVSSVDIEIGKRWRSQLRSALKTSCCGVLCLSPHGLQSQWLMFEAGALSEGDMQRPLFPYLLGMDGGIEKGPLAAFQSGEASEDGSWRLVAAILKAAKVDASRTKRARERFRAGWSVLEKTIAAATDAILSGPRYVPFNRLDDQGFRALLDLYFDATAHQLLAVMARNLEALRPMLDDPEAVARELAKAQNTIARILGDAQGTPHESMSSLVRQIGTAGLPGAFSSLIADAFTVVINQREKLNAFHYDRIPDFQALLWHEMPPQLLMKTVLSNLVSLSQSPPANRISDAHAQIKAAQAGLRTRIDARLRQAGGR